MFAIALLNSDPILKTVWLCWHWCRCWQVEKVRCFNELMQLLGLLGWQSGCIDFDG
ncbi:MAG: hypothetical protein WBA10_19695 [Elainellaceae cyanobacterium]